MPPATRAAREVRTREVIDFGAALGIRSFGCHIGFVPEEANADYEDVREVVRRIADYAASCGMTFCLETGQEPAPLLLQFLKDVARPNVRINFDPANMVLYGSGSRSRRSGCCGRTWIRFTARTATGRIPPHLARWGVSGRSAPAR